MITQADTLRKQIKGLEIQLQHAIFSHDAFAKFHIDKELDEKKSILINIQ